MTPTAESPVANRLDLGEIKPGAAEGMKVFTAVAVFDGQLWSALCPELDIAAEGDRADKAISNLRSAIQEALQTAAEHGVSAGTPASKPDVFAFLQTHRSVNQPVVGQQFAL
jgi:hypothetical protein